MKSSLLAALVLVPVLTYSAAAAPKKKTKVAPKTQGQMQMAGDNGKMGTLYTIGKANPLNVVVEKAAYTLNPAVFDTNTVAAKKDEKLLRIDFSTHNPTRGETTAWYGGVVFTAVGTDGQSYAMEPFIGDPARPGANVQGKMLPAQRIKLFGLIALPAKVGVQKLVVRRMQQTPVLRLNMGQGTNKISPLPASVAVPGTNGSQLATPVPVGKNVPAPLYRTAVTLLETSSQTEPIEGREVERRQKFFVVKLKVKNISGGGESIYGGRYELSLKDGDGETYNALNNYYGARRDDVYNKLIAPGEEGTFRIVFPIPDDSTPTELLLSEAYSNTFRFNLR